MEKYIWKIWKRELPTFLAGAVLTGFALVSLSFAFRAGSGGDFGFFFVIFLIAGVLGVLLIVQCVTSHMDVAQTMREFKISSEELLEDLAKPAYNGSGAKIEIGNKYAIVYDKKSQLVILDRMIWVFPGLLQIDHKLYGVVPLYTTNHYKITVVDREHRRMNVDTSGERASREILELIRSKVPYAIYGYSDQLLEAYHYRFPEFAKEVENRKEEFLKGINGGEA
ncbi:MAG: hypothetical protein IJ794_14835 [Lachnospiraceae bacterium]|nr:hypothetical protein [Lachnospiraceae bacterium]